ncbi:MAG: 2-dehydropantoate 2-reductase N-terminal domain-containing protein [Lachnospiraceae bacterium]|nr:2-dehydropantoate 2-reductase N-terminal domain-containing protein [Lachnospiraceae bacterium]
MRILIIGAGVLGCNLAHNLYKAGKDTTLLARGTWAETIRSNGLVIKNKFSLKPSCDKIPVMEELGREDAFDVIFVCLRYTQLSSIIQTLNHNVTKNVVFIGNNLDAQGLAKELPDKNVMFGFVSSAGHREAHRVESIDMKKITIGDLKTSASHKKLIENIFFGTKYKVIYEPNMGDFLISHGAFIVPAALACYYTNGNLKNVKNDKAFIYKVIDANAECYLAVETLGHELLPRGEDQYRSEKYRKMCYHFYRLMFSTVLGKLCISDHAMSATEELNELALGLEEMIQKAGVEADNFLELKRSLEPYI